MSLRVGFAKQRQRHHRALGLTALSLCSLGLCALWLAPRAAGAAQDNALTAVRSWRVDNPLAGSNDKPAKDLSGIACEPALAQHARRCLIINDENRAAQFVMLADGRLHPGGRVELVPKGPPKTFDGEPPGLRCSGDGQTGKPANQDLDGEAVAYADGRYFVVGSHGCSRSQDRFSSAAFLLASVAIDPADASSAPPARVRLTYRVSEALKIVPLAPYFGKSLERDNGANIEGLAAIGDRLIFGLRAPSVRGTAHLVSVSRDALFSNDAPLDARPIALPLASQQGIRDLAALDDGRLLVLAGPAQNQSGVPYTILLVRPDRPERIRRLGSIADGPRGGKAEALVVFDQSADEAQVLVLFDGVVGGAPRQYRLDLTAPAR